VPLKIWIVLDRLDVAFLDSEELEARALRALFRVYLDITGLQNISLKVFLRDDIWQRITEGGFKEASHITRYTKITWNSQTLLNLVVRRAIHNKVLRGYCNVNAEEVLKSAKLQENLFYRIFPKQVDSGSGKTSTLEWVLSRTRDGTKQTAPRELIHLISSAREQQLRSLEVGGPDPPGEILIDRAALKAGLPEVSSERFHQTLCAEHASLKPLSAGTRYEPVWIDYGVKCCRIILRSCQCLNNPLAVLPFMRIRIQPCIASAKSSRPAPRGRD
jgi:hypothetical protein